MAGRLRREAGKSVLSYETSYRFIYAQITCTKKGYAWRHYRPCAKWKRGWRERRGGSPASLIHLRCPLADRQSPGYWEANLMSFRTNGQAMLTLH